MPRLGGRSLVLLALLCIVTPRARADRMYGILGDLFVLLDTDALSVTIIGDTGFLNVGGLARAPDGTLYGIVTSGADRLITIDPVTGDGTVVGPLGVDTSYSTGLCYDALGDRLLGIQDTGSSNVLIAISPIDGSTTIIGATNAEIIVALDMDVAGDLWGIDGAHLLTEELVRIDTVSGASMPVTPNGLIGYPHIGSLGIGPSGRFWAVNRDPADGYELLEIDPFTGQAVEAGVLADLDGFSGSFTGMTAAESPECLLVVGDGAGQADFTALGHVFQTHLASVSGAYAILMEDVPEFLLPSVTAQALSPSGGSSTSHHGVPAAMADGVFSVQILLWNPQVFPWQPEQVSPGLHVEMLPGGGVLARPFGDGTLGITVETDVDALGRPVVRFPFSIPRS